MELKPEKKYLNTTYPADLLTELRILAARRGVKINLLVEEGIRLVIEKYSMEKPAKE